MLFIFLLWSGTGTAAFAQNAPAPAPDPAQVRENLKNILNDGEFRASAPQEPSLFTKITKSLQEWQDKFRRWLDKLFPSGGSGMGVSRSPGVQWIFIAGFLALGSWLLYRLIRNALTNREKKRTPTRTAFDLDDTEEEIAKEPDAWIQEAEKWLAAGDYRRAYRAVFLATLLLLDRAGLVLFERSRTNGEYLRLLRRNNRSELYALLSPLSLEFELRWYGDTPTTADDVTHIRREYERMQTLLAKGETAPEGSKPDTSRPAAEGV